VLWAWAARNLRHGTTKKLIVLRPSLQKKQCRRWSSDMHAGSNADVFWEKELRRSRLAKTSLHTERTRYTRASVASTPVRYAPGAFPFLRSNFGNEGVLHSIRGKPLALFARRKTFLVTSAAAAATEAGFPVGPLLRPRLRATKTSIIAVSIGPPAQRHRFGQTSIAAARRRSISTTSGEGRLRVS